MKKILWASLLAIGLSTPAFADHVLLGKIVSAGASTNNKTTAVPFAIQQRTRIDVQCNGTAAVRFQSGTGIGTTATTDSFRGIADPTTDTYAADLRKGKDTLAILPTTGAATTCWVYSVVVDEDL